MECLAQFHELFSGNERRLMCSLTLRKLQLLHGLCNTHLPCRTCRTPYTPLERRAAESADEDTVTDEWTLDQPVSQTRTTAVVEVRGSVDVVLTPLVAEALDRYRVCLRL